MKNPFVEKCFFGYQIGFRVPQRRSPLYWTSQKFKNLDAVKLAPEIFKSEEEAENKIKDEIVEYIRNHRPEDERWIME